MEEENYFNTYFFGTPKEVATFIKKSERNTRIQLNKMAKIGLLKKMVLTNTNDRGVIIYVKR